MLTNRFFEFGTGIVTLCGSTKFVPQYDEVNRLLTFENWIVLSCGHFGHSRHKYARNVDRDFATIKKLHYQKILRSQAIVVVSDESGYIGSSTLAEIAFARHLSTPVFYYDGISFTDDSDKIVNELADTSLIDRFAAINGTLGF